MESESLYGSKKEKSLTEAEAELALESLLQEPDNGFLLTIPANRHFIETADSAVDALAFARQKVEARIEQTFQMQPLHPIAGVAMEGISVQSLVSTIKTILANQQRIGEGADAVVVIEKNEIRHLPPEICYKLAKAEIAPRGRNSMDVEAELQAIAYNTLRVSNLKIQVPQPLYQTDFGAVKLIAMEKLPAKSIDEILRGLGTVPDWLDIDAFCAELTAALDALHAAGLFHRDLHIGNIMLAQASEPPINEPHGYIIDFGLSCQANEDFDPYHDEKMDGIFTYNNDYDIIKKVTLALKSARDLASVRGKKEV